MITKEQLNEIAKIKGIDNIGYAEKDYIQEILLLFIYRNFDAFVFKGGTALYKFYKLDRFSEDLDFSITNNIDIEHVISVMSSWVKKFGVDIERIEKKKVYDTVLIKMSLRGVLYDGTKRTLCSIRIDINEKSEVIEQKILTLNSLYPDIPAFQMLVMSEREILAEKIRAIIKRNYARDLYDMWHLIKRGISLDKKFIEKKLKYYDMKFSKKELINSIDKKKDVWKPELRPFVKDLPSFEEVAREIKKIIEDF